MRKILKGGGLFFCVFLSNVLLAGSLEKTVMPLTIKIADDHQVHAALSTVDINRLFVVEDKITSLNAPDERIVAHNEASGSIYINVRGEAPFTAFITTEKGRHFSLFIVPQKIPGVTVRFLPLTPAAFNASASHPAAQQFEKASPYETTLIRVLTHAMVSQQIPGYTEVPASALPKIGIFQLPSKLKASPALISAVKAGYLGGDFAVRVIELKNRSSQAVQLLAPDFYQRGVRAVAIVDERLVPKASTFIYEVVDNV